MNDHLLLELATELGYRLAMSGAETFRVEESIHLVLKAYGLESEAFAIPNCLTVSIETANREPLTRMRRIGHHGNDLDAVERYSNLSRRICAEKPEPETAMQWLKETDASRVSYNQVGFLAGNFLGAAGFAVFFGGCLLDSLCAGICGIIVGLIGQFMDDLHANQFFRTITAAFVMAFIAYGFGAFGIADNADAVIIGTLMILVPGLLFTNAMRDIIYGDTNSGINRIVQVFLIAAALALGTAAAWQTAKFFWGAPVSLPGINHSFLSQELACLVGCIGFAILFNIHGPGSLLCAFGGLLAWAVYSLVLRLGGNDLAGYFFAAVVSSAYSETMARIRKYPAISYLVVSIFPLIPGASIYYTMTEAVGGDMSAFADKGTHTIAIACFLAVGILLVSTSVRLFRVWQHKH